MLEKNQHNCISLCCPNVNTVWKKTEVDVRELVSSVYQNQVQLRGLGPGFVLTSNTV